MSYDVQQTRKDFPILDRQVHGHPLAYLDNAASSQKPSTVIDAVSNYYRTSHANIHRGVHRLSEEATALYEEARTRIAKFIGAERSEEIVFVRGTTEAINLVAQAYLRPRIAPGDEILITHLEHHSNIVPWQMVCAQTGAVLRVAPINDAGEVPLEEFEKLLGERTRMVAVSHVSNALGTVNPLKEMIRLVRRTDAAVLIDGAQAAPHVAVDVRQLDCDFYAFSGHKVYGPTGTGALYGRLDILDAMEPYQGGGEMIRAVSFEGTTYNDVPHKFEAGTPNIAGSIGLGVAVQYLSDLGIQAVAAHEELLLDYATEQVERIDGIRLIGTSDHKAGVLSFTLGDIHPHDVGTILDREGVAVRTGHHCAQPVMDFFGVPATTRASFAAYNTTDEIDQLVTALGVVTDFFG